MSKKSFVFLILVLLVSGCSNTLSNSAADGLTATGETEPVKKIYGYASRMYWTLEEIIQRSDVGVTAVYAGKEEYQHSVDYIFDVQENIWGTTDKRIWVNEPYSYSTVMPEDNSTPINYTTGEDRFTEGELYFLAAEKNVGIVHRHGVMYMTAGSLTIALDRKEVWTYGQKLDYPPEKINPADFLEIYNQVTHESTEEATKEYTDSFEEMWDRSEYVIRVKITGIEYAGEDEMPTNVWYAEVLEQYSGEHPINTNRNNIILLSILKDTVVKGEEYIVGCSCSDRGSLTETSYRQETSDSLYLPDRETMRKLSQYTLQ
jgi:hypothetical protein